MGLPTIMIRKPVTPRSQVAAEIQKRAARKPKGCDQSRVTDHGHRGVIDVTGFLRTRSHGHTPTTRPMNNTQKEKNTVSDTVITGPWNAQPQNLEQQPDNTDRCSVCNLTPDESGAQYGLLAVTWGGTDIQICSMCMHGNPVSIVDIHKAASRAYLAANPDAAKTAMEAAGWHPSTTQTSA